MCDELMGAAPPALDEWSFSLPGAKDVPLCEEQRTLWARLFTGTKTFACELASGGPSDECTRFSDSPRIDSLETATVPYGIEQVGELNAVNRVYRTWTRSDGTSYHVWIRYGAVVDGGVFRRQDRICFGTPEGLELGCAPIHRQTSLASVTEQELEELFATVDGEWRDDLT